LHPTAMATTTTNPFAAASSPLTPMHPTMTEHDFRFPRRPVDPATAAAGPRKTDRFDQLYSSQPSSAAAAAAIAASSASASTKAAVPRIPAAAAAGPASMMMAAGPGALRGDFRLDHHPLTHGSAHHQNDLLRTAAFPPFQQTAARQAQTVDEMQRQDPFALQIWKFYARTKQLLPAQERMENLSWRMMYPKLLRARAANAARYVVLSRYIHVPSKHALWLLDEMTKAKLTPWTNGKDRAVSQAHQQMPPAVLRNCASRRSMPRRSLIP